VVQDLKNKNIPSSFSTLRKAISYLSKKRKNGLIIVFLLSILSSVAESISIAALVPFVSIIISPETFFFNNFLNKIFKIFNITDQKNILAVISLIFIFVVLASIYLKVKYTKYANLAADNITSDFRIRIFNFLINQDFDHFYKHGSNEIMSSLSQKSGHISVYMFAVISIMNSFLISIAIITILIINEPYYTPIIISSVILFFFIVFKIKSNSILQKGKIVSQNQNFIIDIFENTVGYLPEIIIYNLRKFYSSVFSKVSEKISASNAELNTIGQVPRIYLEGFVVIFVVVFIYISGFTERSIEVNVSYLAILAFGAQKCLPLFNIIYMQSVKFRAATPIVLNYLEILKWEKKEKEIDIHHKILDFKESIKIEKLSFKYDKSLPKILNNINFEINKGDKIAIKGDTGSGKSTLVNIISGLLYPSEGKILVDSVELNSKNIKNWQENLAIVPQTVFLNDATILENIAIAVSLKDINFDKAKRSAELAQIDSFIESLPNKYNQKVGERGIRLSGGQRQRIGVARALYKNSNFIILDEPTNALDSETEYLVVDSITKLRKDITVIMISHSNKTLKFFDKIIDLKDFK